MIFFRDREGILLYFHCDFQGIEIALVIASGNRFSAFRDGEGGLCQLDRVREGRQLERTVFFECRYGRPDSVHSAPARRKQGRFEIREERVRLPFEVREPRGVQKRRFHRFFEHAFESVERFAFEYQGFRSAGECLFRHRKRNVRFSRDVGVVPVVSFAVFRVELAEYRIGAAERRGILYAEVFVVRVVQMAVLGRDSKDPVGEVAARACRHERSRERSEGRRPECRFLFCQERFRVFELAFRQGQRLFRLDHPFGRRERGSGEGESRVFKVLLRELEIPEGEEFSRFRVFHFRCRNLCAALGERPRGIADSEDRGFHRLEVVRASRVSGGGNLGFAVVDFRQDLPLFYPVAHFYGNFGQAPGRLEG